MKAIHNANLGFSVAEIQESFNNYKCAMTLLYIMSMTFLLTFVCQNGQYDKGNTNVANGSFSTFRCRLYSPKIRKKVYFSPLNGIEG